MDNNDRPTGSFLSGKDTRIQLMVNRPENASPAVDLGRIFRNVKAKSRVFAWVVVLCLVVGMAAPLLMYQFQKKTQSVTSVVTLRYDVILPDGTTEPVSYLVTPEGENLDLGMVTASSVLKEAVGGLTLSAPVTLNNLRSNITVARVLTEESSRTKEALAGLAEAKSASAYERLENTEMKYQNRFVVSLANGFGDAESGKKELTQEELRIVLNRILDAYNNYLVKQYADVHLPEDEVSVIDPETQDLPEVLESLNTALNNLYTYCTERGETVRAYRSWQTGLSLNDWMETIRLIQSVSVDSLDTDVYSKGLMKDKETAALTFLYRQRILQAELDEINKTIEDNALMLKNYQNSEVLLSMQEADTTRAAVFTTNYYNDLVLLQQEAYVKAAGLRTQIAEMQNRLDRLNGVTAAGDVAEAKEDVLNVLETVRNIQAGIRAHMTELFENPLYTTYSEHSAPQGETESFLSACSTNMILGGLAGVLVACMIWILSALAQELRRIREESDLKAKTDGKEAAEA